MAEDQIKIKTANYFKNNFIFLDSSPRNNISYHFQYLQFLYQIKKKEKVFSTILSLLNKTIIIEMFSIVECLTHNLLLELLVDVGEDKNFKLLLKNHTSITDLTEMATYYKVFTKEISSSVNKLSKYRNSIHIKTQNNGQKSEYLAYSNSILKECEEYFQEILEFIWHKNSFDYSNFEWPNKCN